MAAHTCLAPRAATRTYLRFVVGIDSENPHKLDGLFCHARALRDEGKLEAYEAAWLADVFAWFNANLPCPPFSARLESGRWTHDAVSWFRSDASEALERMWDLVALLREHGVPIRLVRSSEPGIIVYSDDFQVVAETRRRMRR